MCFFFFLIFYSVGELGNHGTHLPARPSVDRLLLGKIQLWILCLLYLTFVFKRLTTTSCDVFPPLSDVRRWIEAPNKSHLRHIIFFLAVEIEMPTRSCNISEVTFSEDEKNTTKMTTCIRPCSVPPFLPIGDFSFLENETSERDANLEPDAMALLESLNYKRFHSAREHVSERENRALLHSRKISKAKGSVYNNISEGESHDTLPNRWSSGWFYILKKCRWCWWKVKCQ